MPSLAYLFSRYPVVSQTFCDTEMLALEKRGIPLVIGSLNPPTTSFRHERLQNLAAEILYPPPTAILDLPLKNPPSDPLWQAMEALARDHDARLGKKFKAHTRARNAWYFARELSARGVRHIHVHFANRATHTALFLKKAGFTFSFTAHAQDFMVDLGSDDLLREMAREAEFVVAVSDFSRDLLQKTCAESAAKIMRVYNGLDPAVFDDIPPLCPADKGLRILSIGRLIEFKGFHHLIEAMRLLKNQGIPATLQIVGEGPWRERLENQIRDENLSDRVTLLGIRSQEQIKHLLGESDVFALGCIIDEKGASDILPTVILEAMAAKRPTVSTRLVGVPEMVEHGVTGWLAAPGNAAELAAHLRVLAEDRPLAARMGEAARRKLEETFTLDKTAGALAKRFAPYLQETPQPAPASVLVLLPAWPLPLADPKSSAEWQILTEMENVRLLAATAAAGGDKSVPGPPPNLLFLPDAIVLESAWRNEPGLVAKAEALWQKCGPLDGETFFRDARRAAFVATQLPHWGIRHVHAWRSTEVPWLWILGQLSQLPLRLTATIEHQPALSRTALEQILPELSGGSLSDAKLRSALPPEVAEKFPDTHLLGPALEKARLFKKKLEAMPDFREIWKGWAKGTRQT